MKCGCQDAADECDNNYSNYYRPDPLPGMDLEARRDVRRDNGSEFV
jgi:hypothetical protein